MRSFSVEHRLLGAFIAGSVLLAITAWFALASGRDYLEASGRADRLADAARASSELVVTVESVQSSQRGYLLRGRDADLAVVLRAPAAFEAALAAVQAILDGDAEAALHLARLTELMPPLLAGLKAPVEARSDGLDAALAKLDATGDEPMTALRAELDALDDLIATRTRAAREQAHAHGDNARHAVWILAVLVIMLFSGAYAIILGHMQDRRGLAVRLKQAANHDSLTGLPNRRFFGEWLGFAIAHARREIRHVGLLFIDVDGVRTIEELHGREAADSMLLEIARRFRETAREGDVLARVGAGQFALAVPDVEDPREVAPLAQRLRDALNDPARPPLAEMPIGASVGVAFYPDDADDPAGVMAAADAAMYAAKGAGKNRVAFKPLAQAA